MTLCKQVPAESQVTSPPCPSVGVTHAVNLAGRHPSGGRGGETGWEKSGQGGSPGRWGRSGCRRLGTPRGSPPPRNPGQRRGWQQPSLKSRSATFSVALGPHPHGPPAHAPPQAMDPALACTECSCGRLGEGNKASTGWRSLPSWTTRRTDFR